MKLSLHLRRVLSLMCCYMFVEITCEITEQKKKRDLNFLVLFLLIILIC